ncbi:Wzz/FepE/Etk N-terminal domain-containing protein [Sphingomonas sp. QA11]|uniref:Wzz/FepE/Etk N-terminal domain-containing protein n=1 Tax=Sphingomonas sp. QA11 TaxID=2950605 RepID=UPI00234AC819|nr:Wzz/FepE/Etk N-terminal domain-containing protein [Sphingomonas sp. QA11]WCM25706.1 Wzz/FepE/Etk N-terminal domain-containing protein [Sphingomonas sp. QA11]
MNVEQSFLIEAKIPERRSVFSAWLIKRRWFIICVIVPTILATIYYGLIASDIYTSESRFVIKSPDQKRAQSATLANIIQTTGLSGGQEQTNEVLAFVRSRGALKSLEQNPGFRSRFASSQTDALSRFPQPFSNDSFEGLFKYYGKMVDARLDSETGMAVITVKAFTAKDAYEINRQLLGLSEGLVNRLNNRAQANGIAEAVKQVDLATDRAKRARLALGAYRNQQELIDPSKQAMGVLEIANSLTAQRSALQVQLELMQRVAPRNPAIPELRNRIQAISGQIASQDSRVVGTDSGIASKLGGYENLLVEQEFATKSLDAANAGLVQARAEAQRQQFYLERVVDPNVPDMPLLPHRILNIIVIAACAICLYFIGWMFTVGILEHASDE